MTIAAFDAHATGYDSVANSALGRELRARVHRVLHDLTAPGDALVDLGCGSGIDTEWLAPQVASVQAFDASAEMVALTKRRCAGLANVMVTQSLASEIGLDERVDVVLANFGVVNCVGDFAAFGERLNEMLVPGGYAVLVPMTRWCPLELALALGSRNRELLTRRSRRKQQSPGGYQSLDLRYASVGDLTRAFDDRFELVRSEALGLVLPPFEQRQWVEHRPRLRTALAGLDRWLGPVGAKMGIGDHHVGVFRAKP